MIDLNRMGAGKKLVQQIASQRQAKETRKQQQDKLNSQKNCNPPKKGN